MCSIMGSLLWEFIGTIIDNYRWVMEDVSIAGNEAFISIVVFEESLSMLSVVSRCPEDAGVGAGVR
jgi:hypothetical protein